MIPFTRRLAWPVEAFEGEFANALERLFNPAEGFNGIEKFAPMCNLAETETNYEVTVELPGMKPEEFNVELHKGELWITGERKEEKEEKGKTYHRVERRYGEFRRVFKLPLAVDEEKVNAEYKEGILRVTVPKVAEAKPKRVEVKT
jgi:HSP20 family protein